MTCPHCGEQWIFPPTQSQPEAPLNVFAAIGGLFLDILSLGGLIVAGFAQRIGSKVEYWRDEAEQYRMFRRIDAAEREREKADRRSPLGKVRARAERSARRARWRHERH